MKRIDSPERKKKKAKQVTNWRIRSKKKLVEHFGGKCRICGYKKSIQALTFHHIDPSTKKFGIGGKTLAYEKLLEEANKCLLICHNCHAEVHAGLVKI